MLASRLRDLNIKIEDIRREQQYQREREADFRNLSETTNSRAVWYSIAQIVVLLSTCAWQLRHLRVSTMALFYLVSIVNGKFLAILRGSEDALAYSYIPSICSNYIKWLRFGELCLFVVSLDPEDYFSREAAQRYFPENLINCTRGLHLACFFLNGDNLVLRLLKLVEQYGMNSFIKRYATPHLPRGHYSREFLDELELLCTIIFVPPAKPKSVARKVLEYVERRGNWDGTFRHCAVRHQMRVFTQEACHGRC